MIAPVMGEERNGLKSFSEQRHLRVLMIRISGMTKRVIPRKGGDALWQSKAKRKQEV